MLAVGAPNGPHPCYHGPMSSRRGWREDGVFFEHNSPCRDGDRHRHCDGRWRGVISLGFGLFVAYRIGFVDGLFTGNPLWTPR